MGRTFDKGVLVGVGLVVALLVGTPDSPTGTPGNCSKTPGGWPHPGSAGLTSDVLRPLVDAETGGPHHRGEEF